MNGSRMRAWTWGDIWARGQFDERLPWSFIDMGVEEQFLLTELEKADTGQATVDCYEGCAVCGIDCKEPQPAREEEPLTPIIPADKDEIPDPGLPPANGDPVSHRFTFRYGKYGDARYMGHLDTMGILLRAFRSAGISIKMHRKYHPLPKIALSDALPMGIESMCELIELESNGTVFPDDAIISEMNKRLPKGIRIFEWGHGRMQDMARECLYLLISDKPVDMEEFRRKSERGKYFYILKERKGIKELWKNGIFTRIVRMEARRINGIGTDN